MYNLKKPNKQSGKAQLALLIAVALAAGSAGVWSELHAAGATVSTVKNRNMNGNFSDGTSQASFQMNSDGFMQVNAWGPGFNANAWDWNASVSVHVRAAPNAGKGSAVGSGTAQGTFWTPSSGNVPAAITVDATLDFGAWSNESTFNNHNTQAWASGPGGPIQIIKTSSQGSQVWGQDGSGTLTVNGVALFTGDIGFGQAWEARTHTIQRIK